MLGLTHHQLKEDEIYDILRPGYNAYTIGLYKGKKNGKLQFYNNRPARHTTYEVTPSDELRFELKKKGDRWRNIPLKGGKVGYVAANPNQATLANVIGFKKENSNTLMKIPTLVVARKKIAEYIEQEGLFYEDRAFLKRNGLTLTDFMNTLYRAYEAAHTDACSISDEDKDFITKHRRLLDGLIQKDIMNHILGVTSQYSLQKYDPSWFKYYTERCQAGGNKTRKRLRKRGKTRR